jgi:hypothetical protein
MSGKINVVFEDGKLAFCKVVESLGYNHDAGAYCKIVEHDGREMLVKCPRSMQLWRPHTARDRVKPLVDHMARLKRERKITLEDALKVSLKSLR